MTTTLRIDGLRASGRHGANPGERDQPQEFVIDVEVDVSPGGDELAGTADYREIVRAARSVVEDHSFLLLETIAHEIASAVCELDRVGRARVVVHKPGAASSLDVAGVSAEAVAE